MSQCSQCRGEIAPGQEYQRGDAVVCGGCQQARYQKVPRAPMSRFVILALAFWALIAFVRIAMLGNTPFSAAGIGAALGSSLAPENLIGALILAGIISAATFRTRS